MNISHLFVFTLQGGQQSSDAKKIPCRTQNLDPKNCLREAYRKLKMLMDSYAARNYWAPEYAVSSYRNPVWKTPTRLRENISNFSFVSSVSTERQNNETYHIIDTQVSVADMQKFLNRYYNTNHNYNLRKESDDIVLYSQWRTDI